MQPLARDGLTAAQVRALLVAPAIEVAAGCELLDASLKVVADLSDDLVAGTVNRTMANTVHGTCKLALTRDLAWGTALVRPYMRLTGQVGPSVLTARFNLGVFCLVTPEQRAGEQPVTFDVEGYDRLYLLAREVGNSYQVTAGTPYLQAVRDAIAAAGLGGVLLDGSAAAVTLPQTRTWPLLNIETGSDGKRDKDSVTTWLRVVNDLLEAINYRGLYADQDGVFRSEPYAEPSARPVEFTFNADEQFTIVGEQRRLVQDQYRTPNRWVFIQQNLPGSPPPEPVEGAGIYTVNNVSSGLSSQTARGLVWAKTVKFDAADQASLVALGNRTVAADLRVTATLVVDTGPMPAAGHYDVLSYSDTALGGTRKVQAVSWSLDLLGADMSWTWEQVA